MNAWSDSANLAAVPRVLVVDDSADDYELISRQLRRRPVAGLELAGRVDTAAELRRAVEEAPPDAVILDWVLPQYSAPEALHLLAEIAPRAVAIVVSGAPSVANVVTAMRLGAKDFLDKTDLTALSEVLERELAFRGG